jgi:EmrB/QacA subfamily drug resistance transporter
VTGDGVSGRRARERQRATLGILVVGVFAFGLQQSLVSPVLPVIQRSMHTSENAVTWVLTAYLVSASVCTPILGRLGDMWGKKRFLVVALVGSALGGVVAGFAHQIGMLILARAIQGLGGGVLPLSFSILRDEHPPEKLASAIGVLAALVAVGSGLGTVLGGPIASALNYHWLFWLPAIVMFGAVVAAEVVIPESGLRSPGRIRWSAVLLLSGWLVALLVGVSNGPSWGWTSPQVLGLFAMAAVLAVGWVAVESSSANPLVDLKMMRIPTVSASNLCAMLLGAGLYSVGVFVPQFVQAPTSTGYGFGVSATRAGLILLPQAACMFVTGMLAGPLSDRIGSRAVLIIGAALSVPAVLMLTLAHSQEWQLVVAVALEGASFGLAFAAMSALVVRAVPPSQTGVASGMNANIRTIGGSIGTAVVASVVTAGVAAGAYPSGSAYTRGFALLTVVAVAATAMAFLVPKAAVRRSPASAAARSQVVDRAEAGAEPLLGGEGAS